MTAEHPGVAGVEKGVRSVGQRVSNAWPEETLQLSLYASQPWWGDNLQSLAETADHRHTLPAAASLALALFPQV